MSKLTLGLTFGAAALALAACSSEPEANNDVIAVFAKDGSIISYQRASDGVETDAAGNPVAGFGEGNPRGFGGGTGNDAAATGPAVTDDNDSDDDSDG